MFQSYYGRTYLLQILKFLGISSELPVLLTLFFLPYVSLCFLLHYHITISVTQILELTYPILRRKRSIICTL